MAACGQLGDLASSPRPAPMLVPPERLREAMYLKGDDGSEVIERSRGQHSTLTY